MESPSQITSRASAVALADIPRIPLSGSVSWVPIRSTLGYQAHGINAWVADAVGADVIERHRESASSRHQELYLVVTGRARFEVDGEQIDAPAGTLVCVPDWQSERCAIAEEAGTTVLSLGGPPTFSPSPWEWTHRALLQAKVDPEEARAIFEDGLRTLPDSAAMHYNYACLEARLGQPDAALARLKTAIELKPDLRTHARDDADLDMLHGSAGFADLVGG